jgi:pimeloyl-ACP methyl ester carboxylesterase
LLLHGGRDHCRNWDWVASDLAKDWHIIAPDLRGHGDSAWSPDGNYTMSAFTYDLAQLIHQQASGPIHIIAHSLGGSIALRYTGLYPENVAKLVAIEGLFPPPHMVSARMKIDFGQRFREWVEDQRKLSSRMPKRYATMDEALQRMQSENKHLSAAQAEHLTRHGMLQNEDSSFSWKFDNYVRSFSPVDMTVENLQALWGRITCPTRLLVGTESFASNPAEDGRLGFFQNASVSVYDRAGHWLHHDQTEKFIAEMREFL